MMITITFQFAPEDRVVLDNNRVGVIEACSFVGGRNEYFVRFGLEQAWVNESHLEAVATPEPVV